MAWTDKTEYNIPFDSLEKRVTKPKRYFTKAIVTEIYYQNEKVGETNYTPGTIRVVPVGYGGKGVIAYPIDEAFTSLPLVNEIVEVFMISTIRFYRRLTFTTPSINTSVEVVVGASVAGRQLGYGPSSNLTPSTTLSDFNSSTVQTNAAPEKSSKLGSYFKKEKIHRLKLYEGDTVLQSRFGQSIRMSAYNNSFNKSNPTLIIRNGESALLKENEPEENGIEEDINRDFGTIAFLSGKYQSDFLPGVIDRNKKSNFELKVWENKDIYALESYPKKLDGNQLIITSDRLILSSRANEMMLFSKGPMSFVADSYLTIDTLKGMSVVSQKGNLQFEAKELQMNFFVGEKGKINLAADPNAETKAVVSKELTALVGELINEIISMCVNGGILTPSGPSSGINPANREKLKSIIDKLESTCSKRVFVGM